MGDIPGPASAEDRAARAIEFCLTEPALKALGELAAEREEQKLKLSDPIQNSEALGRKPPLVLAFKYCSKDAIENLPNAEGFPPKDPEFIGTLIRELGPQLLGEEAAEEAILIAAYRGESKYLRTLSGSISDRSEKASRAIVEAATISENDETIKIACEIFPKGCGFAASDAIKLDLLLKAIRKCDQEAVTSQLGEIQEINKVVIQDFIGEERGRLAPLLAKHCGGEPSPSLLFRIHETFPQMSLKTKNPTSHPDADSIARGDDGATAAHFLAMHGNRADLEEILRLEPKLKVARDASGANLSIWAIGNARWSEYENKHEDPAIQTLLWLILEKSRDKVLSDKSKTSLESTRAANFQFNLHDDVLGRDVPLTLLAYASWVGNRHAVDTLLEDEKSCGEIMLGKGPPKKVNLKDEKTINELNEKLGPLKLLGEPQVSLEPEPKRLSDPNLNSIAKKAIDIQITRSTARCKSYRAIGITECGEGEMRWRKELLSYFLDHVAPDRITEEMILEEKT